MMPPSWAEHWAPRFSPATDSNGAVMLSQQAKNNGQGESKPGEESFIQGD